MILIRPGIQKPDESDLSNSVMVFTGIAKVSCVCYLREIK